MQTAYCRVAPSLGELESTHQIAWGTHDYIYPSHKHKPTVFFGLYDLRDYLALRRHRGHKWVLWAGGDLENLVHGFVFNDGKLRWLSKLFPINFWLVPWLRRAEHYVEDHDEAQKLFHKTKIRAKIVPSFLGDIEQWADFNREYYHQQNPEVYVSAPRYRAEEYGFDTIERIADKLPRVRFHLYGASWNTKHQNVIVHGRVSKEQFNREIRYYQCGLRLNRHDGFSEITAKSILMGQYPITYLTYPLIPSAQNDDQLISYLKSLKGCTQPNRKAKQYYIHALNYYPWNAKK